VNKKHSLHRSSAGLRENVSMKASAKHSFARQVIAYEIAAFAAVILLLWLDEIADLPSRLLGAEATPVNWRESLFESLIIAALCLAVIRLTRNLFQRMKYLEGLLPVCSACHRIRGEHGGWLPLESYILEQSDAKFTHGICPDCAEKLYPEYNPYKK
jgi:hypothetical protein